MTPVSVFTPFSFPSAIVSNRRGLGISGPRPVGQAWDMPSLWAGGQEDTAGPRMCQLSRLRFPSGKEGAFLQVAKDRGEALDSESGPGSGFP